MNTLNSEQRNRRFEESDGATKYDFQEGTGR